ncbi:hypothetical protein JCM8097_005737 [Rhodosporidiobolus ruineniae]
MSSSSSPSAIPPLPAELILHILHLAHPPHAEYDHRHRRRDLLRCCLVCKAWRELAEPLLWHSLTIRSNVFMDRLALLPEWSRRWIRRLYFRGGTIASAHFRLSRFRVAFRLCPAVEFVRVVGAFKLDQMKPLRLSDFQSLSNLRSLSITSNIFIDPNASLPKVEILDFSGVHFRQDFVDWLTPAAFPSLRHLSLGHIPLPTIPRMQPSHLPSCLKTLELDAAYIRASPDLLKLPFRSILLTFAKSDLLQWHDFSTYPSSPNSAPLYVRFIGTAVPWILLTLFFDLPRLPHALFLPHGCDTSPTASVFHSAARASFLQESRRKGLEVRYYRSAKEEWHEVGCREFREYVEERERMGETWA